MSERRAAIEQHAVRDVSSADSVEVEAVNAEEVPPGHKRTEVGMIPSDWRVRVLQELIDSERGIRYGIVQPGKYDQNGRYMIRGQDYADGWAHSSTLFRVSSKIEKPYRNARVRSGDILITIVGASTGRVAVVPDWLDNANLTQTTARISIDPGRAERQYVDYVLESRVGSQQVENYIKGGAQPGLNCGDIEKFLIPTPPTRVEQRAIATALSDADALIESLDRLIAKKRAIKQAAMQQLLTGQTRLPGFSGEWETKRFSEALMRENVKPYQIQTADYQDSGKYPVVDQGKQNIVGFTDLEDKVFPCPEGGIIVFGDHTCIIKYIDFDFSVGADGTQVLRAKSAESTKFYAYQLEHKSIEPTGYNRHFKFLKEREFLVPPLDEQTAIATILSDMDAEIDALERRRGKAQQIKQGMMQQLLTGRVRLETSHQSARAS